MEYAPQLTPEAQADIANACRYIKFELENHQAAINLANGIYEVIYGLNVMPNRNPVWPREPWRSRGVRCAAYKNYNIFYAVDDAEAIVKVLRVFYNRRNV